MTDTLPKGLSLHSRDDALEVARSNAGDARLLAFTQGLEVIKGTLEKGHRLHLYPSKDPNYLATEINVLLHGSLSYQTSEGHRQLGPGDYIIAQGLQEAAIFTTLTDIVFLYLSTQPSFHEISASLKALKALTEQIAEKDAGETIEHCRRMRDLSYAMGKRLGLPAHRMHLLDHAAYFHDVGKLEVPVQILQKPSALSPDEWVIMRRHPVAGKQRLESTLMKAAGSIVEHHHERLDGSGYPHGLRGDDISTEASIIAVAASYDAMTSNRPYRRALTQDAAFSELTRYADRHYPGEIVDALFKVVEVPVY